MLNMIKTEREALAARFTEGQQQLRQLQDQARQIQEQAQRLNEQLIAMAGGINVYDELIKKAEVKPDVEA